MHSLRYLLMITALLMGAVWMGPGGCSGEVQSQDPAPVLADNTSPVTDETPAETPDSRSERAMPDFVLQDLDGNLVKLSDFSGKAVLLNFWATWCGPCRTEMPDLVKIQNQFGGDEFTVIAVALDQTGPVRVRQFTEQHELNFPVVMGNQTVVIQYGNFRGIPVSFLLNGRHELVKRYGGPVTKRLLERDLGVVLTPSA